MRRRDAYINPGPIDVDAYPNNESIIVRLCGQNGWASMRFDRTTAAKLYWKLNDALENK